MKIYDISVSLSDNTPRWPGSVGFHRSESTQNDPFIRNSTISMDVHCGTHLDAPSHHFHSGRNADEINLDQCIGSVIVLDCTNLTTITSKILDQKIAHNYESRILLKSNNSLLWAEKSCECDTTVSLSLDAAHWLIQHKIVLIGFDWLSIQRYHDLPDVHQYLLQHEVVILEGINLSGIETGIYDLICLPLKIQDGEAAPARVVLLDHGMIQS